MPKQRSNKKRRSVPRPVSAMSRTVMIPFRDVTSVLRTTSSGYEVTSINLNIPSFASTSRMRVMGAMYEYFRLKYLTVEAISDTTAVNVISSADTNYQPGYSHGLAFLPSNTGNFTIPSSYDALNQLPEAVMGPSHKTLRLRMRQAQLSGSTPVKWYHTATSGSPPLADSSAGAIIYITRNNMTSGSALTYSYLRVSGVMEFKAPLANGSAFSPDHCVTLGEDCKLRIDTLDHFDHDEDPRTSVRSRSALQAPSVPNTPSSRTAAEAKASYSGISERSDRQLERPRLVRQ